MPRTVTASEANQNFSRLLREAAAGETITITQRGKPVARIVPEGDEAERAARREAMERWLREAEGRPTAVVGPWARGDLYG